MTVENGYQAFGSLYYISGEDGDDTIQGNQDGETQAHSSILLEGGAGNDTITGINNSNA